MDDRPKPDEGQAEPAPPAAAPPAAPADPLAALEREKGELRERLLRTAADFDNYKKRARKELDDAALRAREAVLRDILPGIDNLERAVSHAEAGAAGSIEPLIAGVRMTLKQLLAALERAEVRPFGSLGEAFDPARHEAVHQAETVEAPPGTIIQELQRGYTIGPRLLRPAMVSVAKAPAGPPEPPEPGAVEVVLEGADDDASVSGDGQGRRD